MKAQYWGDDMAYTTKQGVDKLAGYLKKEINFPGLTQNYSNSRKAKRIQEWLYFHGFHLEIDGKFGDVSENKVRAFQSSRGLPDTGKVDEATYQALVQPLLEVLKPLPVPPSSFEACMAAYAQKHLANMPHEIGGQNSGPWVRAYMEGNDGPPFAWCAGFIQFIMRQAAETLDMDMPVKGDWLCTNFAKQAKKKDLLHTGGSVDKTQIVPGSLFIAKKATGPGYAHIGLVTHASSTGFETIEGNTNLAGGREGYKVAAQSRGYGDKYDFVIFNPNAPHINNMEPQPFLLAGTTKNVDLRRYFYEGLIPVRGHPDVKQQGYVYGSLFAHWGGWVTAGHVLYDANHNPPPYANGSVIYRPGKLDAALVGCRLPSTPPPNVHEGDKIIVSGYPAGSATPAIREGAAHIYRKPESWEEKDFGRWVIRIDLPTEPVVSGMSGGVALNATTGDIVGIVTHSNSPHNIDGDPEDDHSLDIVSLHDVWHAVKDADAPLIV